VGELLEFARKELAEQQRRARVAGSVSRARALMDQEQFDQAIALLEPAIAETGDPSLDRLLAEARAQRQEAGRKVEAQLARIARFRERGQLQEAIDLLQALPAAAVSGTELNTLLSEVRAEQARRQATESALADASAAADRDSFQSAIESLQAVQRAWGESPEIAKAIGDIESRRGQLASGTVAKVVETARAALLSNDAAAAVEHLRGVAKWVEFAGVTQQSDWRRLGAEASKPAARRSTGEVPQIGFGPGEPEAAPRKSKLFIPLIAAGAVAVIAAVVLVMHFSGTKPALQTQNSAQPIPAAPAPAAAPPSGTLAVAGNQASVQIFVDGLLKGFTQQNGSLDLPLDPGTHTIRLSKSGYSDVSPSTVTIAANQKPRFTTISTGRLPPRRLRRPLKVS
jgi:hypothetical protein